jgi:stage V sporulation protein AC
MQPSPGQHGQQAGQDQRALAIEHLDHLSASPYAEEEGFILLDGIFFLSGVKLGKIYFPRGVFMDMTNQDYGKLVNDRSKPSPMGKNLVWAFLVGGAICTIGQGLSNLYQSWGLDKDQAGTAVSVTLIFAAALLTGLGCFDKLAKRAGAGTLVPITGFANAMVSPALEFKSEGLITGTAAKLFVVAGPVLVFGISASVIYGLILLLFQLV